MLATDRFMFLSAGRSSTGTVYRWMEEVAGLRIISGIPHEARDSMIEKYEALGMSIPPTWTIVRNPWDRYVDSYFWDQCRVHRHDGDFKGFLARTVAKERGFPSYTVYWDYVGGDKSTYVARYEALDDEIVRVVMALIPDLVTEEFIRRSQEKYRTEGDAFTPEGKPWRLEPPGSYIPYYDEESRDWVAKMDAKLISRFGYKFNTRAHMWVQLRTVKCVEYHGKLVKREPGDWVQVGQLQAMRWLVDLSVRHPQGEEC